MSEQPGRAETVSVPQRTISAAAAHAAVRAAVAHAETLGIRINAAVCDPGGTLVAFLRMPGAFVPSVEIAIDKAYTAAGFGFPTGKWADVFAQDESLRLGFPPRPRIVVFAGGLPIRDGDQLIGAIGVSGGSAEQDERCAQAGIDAILAGG
ncbi:MAG: heme-binding protein [Burkholderiaceae bacterium]